ncbi:MAG: RNA polymerase sigma factor RpoH [Candidatus Marinimicrobia bacterium]|nr:RNA polymerase sigma factor RpoH [Candidatus Neomarinimicrobiota bacterium]|tara:strand:+ start:36 stop:938 length:903 start_codon:yes stop_codon:yes gene_type:complete
MLNSRVPVLASDSGLSAYMVAIKKFPMLEPEQEYMLAHRYAAHDDLEAAHELVTSHLRLVAKIAMGYRFYGLPVSDLISEGNVGLMRAVKKFDPERGFRLATYAMWWIKAAINEYVLSSWSLVKVGTVAAQKKLFFNLRKLKAKLGQYGEGDISDEAAETIARRLDVSTTEVINMDRRLTRSDASLNQPVIEDGDAERQDLLVDESPDQETVLAEKEERALGVGLLRQAMDCLNKRERHIIEERRLAENPRTLEDIGQEYGISRERVRQIENRAFEKLQKAVLAMSSRLESESAMASPSL